MIVESTTGSDKVNESPLAYYTAGVISSPLMRSLCTNYILACTTEKLINNYFAVIAFSAKSTHIKISTKQKRHYQCLSVPQ